MDPLIDLVRRARRRVVRLRALSAAGWAISCVLACFAVVLIGGLDVVGWRWLWLAGLAATFWAGWKTLHRLPTPYVLAQELDHRSNLRDTLASAWYASEARLDSPAARHIHAAAANMAKDVNVAAAFPFRDRKPFLIAGALFSAALVLFCVRYWTVGRLDLHPSCLTLWIGPSIEKSEPVEHAERAQRRNAAQPGQTDAPGNAVPDQSDRNETAKQASPDAPQASGRPGVLSRLQDALSSLLGRTKTTGGQQANQEDSASAGKGSENPKANQQSGANGEGQKSKQASQNAASKSDSQTGQQSNGQPQQQAGMSQGAGQKADGNANSAESGAGSNEGSKRILSAAELKAMGKIEELMSKQAADVSGEMSIVKTTGPQQLSTPYSDRQAAHEAADSSVSGEQMSPADREFVRKYMDEMHRISDKQGK